MTRRRHKLPSGDLFASLEPAEPAAPPAVEAAEVLPPPPPEGPTAPAVDTPPSLAVREVLSLPPVLLAAMPEATTLALRARSGAQWYVTTGREAYAALRGASELVFTGAELGAMAVAAELDRASSLALDQWLTAKGSEGAPRLDVAAALGGLTDLTDTPVQRWTLERVLWAMGARLERVAVGDGAHPEWL